MEILVHNMSLKSGIIGVELSKCPYSGQDVEIADILIKINF